MDKYILPKARSINTPPHTYQNIRFAFLAGAITTLRAVMPTICLIVI